MKNLISRIKSYLTTPDPLDAMVERFQLGNSLPRRVYRVDYAEFFDLDHRSGFALRSLVGSHVGTCEVAGCDERTTHILWGWDGSDYVESCDRHKAGKILLKVSSGSYRSQVKGTRIIEDDDPIEAIREATIAALERIESNSRYAYHELSDTCYWMRPVRFKGRTFSQALIEAKQYRHLTLHRSA